MKNQIIIVWCLLSIVNCFKVYKGVKTKEMKSLLSDSILKPEYMKALLYISAVLLAPLFLIVNLIEDLEAKNKKMN